MTTNIGRVEFIVGADGTLLPRDLRRVGRTAGAIGGKELNKALNAEVRKGTREVASSFGRVLTTALRTSPAVQRLAASFRNLRSSIRGGLDRTLVRISTGLRGFGQMLRDASARNLAPFIQGMRDLRISAQDVRDTFPGLVRAVENIRTGFRNAVTGVREFGQEVRARGVSAMDELRQGAQHLKISTDDLAKTFPGLTRVIRNTRSAFDRIGPSITTARTRITEFATKTRDSLVDIDKVRPAVDRLRDSFTRLRGATNSLRGLRTEVGEFVKVSKSLSGDHELTRFFDSNGRRWGQFGAEAEGGMSRAVRAVRNGNRNLDAQFGNNERMLKSRVARLIVLWTALVAAIGEGTASLGSGAGAALTGLISSLGVALVGALGIAGAAISGFVVSMALAINSFRFMKEEVPAVADALSGLSAAAEDSGRRFARAWGPSVANFLNTLTTVLGNTGIIDAFAASLSKITDAFSAALTSPGFTLFYEALTTTIPNAMASLGSGAASLASGLAAVFAAASPALQTFAGQFATWAEKWTATMTAAAQDGSLQTFFNKALDSINAVIGVVGSLGGALNTLFQAGAENGNSMLNTLTGLFNQWNDWMKSIEGQKSLETWFANGERVFDALLGLAGKLGSALADLVTPETIDRLLSFIDGLGDFLPVASQILGVVGKLDVLNIVVGILNSLAAILEPLLPVIGELAEKIGSALVQGFAALEGPLTRLGQALAPVVQILGDALMKILPPLLEALGPVVDAFADIVVALTPLIELLAAIVANALPPLIAILPQVADYLVALANAIFGTNMSAEDFGKAIVIVGDIVRVTFETIGNIISVFFQVASGILNTISSLLRGDFSGAFTAMQDTVSGVFDTLGLDFDAFVGWFTDMYRGVVNFVSPIGGFFYSMASAVSDAISGMIGWIQDAIGWFQSLFGAANNATSAANSARSASGGGGGGGSGGGMASGGLLNGPRRILAGEAGPEAVVPLQRPLSQVDPSVRWLSALAQGKTPAMASGGVVGSGRTVNIESGAIVVQESGDPARTSIEVLDRIAERVDSLG